MDSEATVEDLKKLTGKFRDDRDWKQFHKPKDLAIHLCAEAGELIDLFRYKSNEKVEELLSDPKWRQDVSNEMADVLWALLHMSEETGIDLSEALKKKLELTEKKYPVDLVKGNNKKYSDY